MSYVLSLLALLLIVAAFTAWLRARHLYVRSGLPSGRLLYTDTGTWRRPEAPLFSVRHQVTGKPDYLVEASGHIIPLEVKSGSAPSHPYRSHRLQLAAYCLLVEDVYRQAPPYGLLKYADNTVTVEYTAELRDELLAVLRAMRQDARAAEVPRRHDHAARCRACGFRAQCDQALV